MNSFITYHRGWSVSFFVAALWGMASVISSHGPSALPTPAKQNNPAPMPRAWPRLELFLLEFHRAKPEGRARECAACATVRGWS